VIDVDPYGFPSRYFPTVFGLIDDGVLFLTFPVMGVAQINKITIEHYRVFWDINLSDKDCYTDKIVKKLKDYAFMQKRSIEVLEIKKIDRIYRFAIKVKQESLLKIVGLEVNKK
jgi:tRNA G26 N,N-dimethylase Trm1